MVESATGKSPRDDVLWVATRKGLFRLEPDGDASGNGSGHTAAGNGNAWRITQLSFIGQPVTMILPDARDGSIYAALNLGHFGVKLHRSDDGGNAWTEIAVPAYPKGEDPEPAGLGAAAAPTTEPASEVGESADAAAALAKSDATALKQIWCLEPAGPRASDGIWCGTLPGGLFFSAERGASWTLNLPLWEVPERKDWFGGGYDTPGIHSICVDPRDSRHVMVAVSCAGVWRTRDGGRSWSQTAHGMVADYMPPQRQLDPHIQDPHRMVQCPAEPDALWVQHHNGVFRSTNCAERWERVTTIQPSGFGFGVVVHPRDPQTAWFVPAIKDELRVPVDGRLVVARTSDGGKTCEVLSDGLPQVQCYDLVYRHALEIDASGDLLAIGSTTGNLWTSATAGERWQQLPHHLPPIYALRFA